MKFVALNRVSQGAEFTSGLALRELKYASRENFLPVLESRVNQLSSVNDCLDLNALSKAGQAIDRNGLTKAGRAFQKHCNRPNCVFQKLNGNAQKLNEWGQFAKNRLWELRQLK